MMAEVLRASPERARRALEACGFVIVEAVWYERGMLRLYFGSTRPVPHWALAELPHFWLLVGERVEAFFEDAMPCITDERVSGFAEYKTAVHPSAPLILKETSTRDEPNMIVLVAR